MRKAMLRYGLVVAAALNGACTSDLKQNGGPDPATIITTIIVTPSSITTITGNVIRLSAYAINQLGDSVSAPISWTSDGGELGSNGTFISSVGGSFRVIARSVQQPFPADTAVVTVTSSASTVIGLEINPPSVILAPGETRPFLVDGLYNDSTRGPAPVTWSATGGTITAGGVFTAGSTAGTFTVVATSTTAPVADTAIVSITAMAPTVLDVLLAPDSVQLDPSDTVTFVAFGSFSDGTVSPLSATFSVTAGSITQQGFYRAGSVAGTYSVIARHAASGKADTAPVIVTSAFVTSIALSPASAALTTGGTQQFAVIGTFSNGTTAPVSALFSANGGTIGQSGLYVAGNTPGTYRVIATTADFLHADTAIVTLNGPAATLTRLRMTPDSVSLLAGGTAQFSVSGIMSDGTTITINPNYAASAGTISASGAYTAPQVAGLYRVIATDPNSGRADTSAVAVTQPVNLVRINVTPATTQLIVGGIQQFSAAGVLSNGAGTSVTVTWSTNDPGGSITSGGQYHGGTTPGTYRVIARQQGGTLADTSTVDLISAPPTGTAACGHEPAGLTLVSETPWDAVPPQMPALDGFGWNVESGMGRLSIQQDPAAIKSPLNSLAGLFPQGAPGGRGPFRLNRNFSNVTTIYMCIFTKLDAAFTNNNNAGTKFGFFTTPYQGGTTGLNHYFNLTDRLGVALQSGDATLNRNMYSTFSLISNRGVWHKIELLVIGNTLSSADGVARMWVNDAQVLNITNVQYFYPGQTPRFNGVTWNPTYGGGTNPVPYNMYQWVDHWRISGD